MDLFTYLMAKNDHNTSVNKDLFSYLLGKGQSGTYSDYSGTSLSINNTKKGKMKLYLSGNTEQDGTPTPDAPQTIHNVNGENEVVVSNSDGTQSSTYPLNLPVGMELNKISTYKDGFIINSGKNLFDIQSIVKGRLDNGVIGYESATTSVTLNDTSFSFTTNATWRGVSTEDYIEVKSSTDYVLKIATTSTTGVVMACYDENKTWLSNATQTTIETGTTKFTTPASTKYARISIQLSTTGTCNIDIPQLTESSTALPYEPYGSGEWYYRQEIGSITFNGNESWNLASSGTNTNLYWAQLTYISADVLSNYFTRNDNLYNEDVEGMRGVENNDRMWFRINKTTAIDKDAFKTWLSTHNTTVYYVLATPTYTKITDTNLINQLENVYRANSYKDQTNISQTNNDLPFNLDVEVKVSA